MEYWKKNLFELFLIEFSKYYVDSTPDFIQGNNIVPKLNKEELKILNEKINLTELVGCKKEIIINRLLKDSSKDKFTFYLISTSGIECEVNSYNEKRKTVFIEIAERFFEKERYKTEYLISALFERGYTIKKEDIDFVLQLRKKIQKQNDFDKWMILRFATRLNNKKKFEIAQHNFRELSTILSFKLGRPIHFNFPNLIGVANNAITHYRDSGDLILKSIERFGQTDTINQLDKKKGTFKRKRLEYLKNKPIQNKEFEKVAIELFPDLEN